MFRIRWFLFVILQVAAVQGLKSIPTRSKILYYNPEYAKDAITSVRRSGRGSSYHFNLSFQLLKTVDNKMTSLLQFYEVLSGNYVLLPVRIQFKMCDFFNNDQLLGKVILKQFPKNLTCPFEPGWYSYQNLTYENEFAFDMPFTFQGIETVICLDFQVTMKDTEIFHLQIHMKIIQKPRNSRG